MQLSVRKSMDWHIVVVLAVFGTLLLLLLISPYLVPAGQLHDLSGDVFSADNAGKFAGINPVAWTVYSFGDLNCHQLRDRTFFLNDNQMPMCSRDTGIFIGLFSGALAMFFVSFSIRKRWLFVGLLPMLVDGALQAAGDYESDNSIRVITGFFAGAAVAIFICLVVVMPDGEAESEEATSSEDRKIL